LRELLGHDKQLPVTGIQAAKGMLYTHLQGRFQTRCVHVYIYQICSICIYVCTYIHVYMRIYMYKYTHKQTHLQDLLRERLGDDKNNRLRTP